jgi:hypothetical protein
VREEYVLDNLGSDDLAGTAPGGEEVDDHHAGLVEGGIEVGLTTQSRRHYVSFLRCADSDGVARERLWARDKLDLRGEVVDTGRHVGRVLAGLECVVVCVCGAVGESVCGGDSRPGEGSE